MRQVRALLALPTLALVLASCGSDSDNDTSTGGARTVDIEMVDNAFEPTSLQVETGETITFRFSNTGSVRHEGVIGDEAAQERHHDEMTDATSDEHAADTTGMAGHGGDGTGGDADLDAVTVEPGETGELTHTFDTAGTIVIGCHETGHWEAGMKVTIDVG